MIFWATCTDPTLQEQDWPLKVPYKVFRNFPDRSPGFNVELPELLWVTMKPLHKTLGLWAALHLLDDLLARGLTWGEVQALASNPHAVILWHDL